MKKGLVFSFWVILSTAFWIANYLYPSLYLEKGFYTFLVLSLIYLVFKLFLQERIAKTIKDKKTKYSFSKVLSILYIAIFIIVLITIWVENPQDIQSSVRKALEANRPTVINVKIDLNEVPPIGSRFKSLNKFFDDAK